MAASRVRTRVVLAIDALLVVACLFGLDGLARKADLPATLAPASWAPRGASVPTGPIVAHAHADGGLQAGDIVRNVSGQEPSNADELEFVCDLTSIGDPVRVRVWRDGRETDVSTTLVPRYSGIEVAIDGLAAAVFFGLAILVTLRRPDDQAALLFHASSASFAILIAATWGALRGGPPGVAPALRALFGAAYALAPALFLHFTLVFPRRARIKPRGVVALLYAGALVLATGQGLTFWRAAATGTLSDFRPFLAWFNATNLYAAVGLSGAILRLVYAYATATEEGERRRVRLVLPGFAVPVLAFVVLNIVPQRTRGQALLPEAPLNLAALVAPLTFAAAIVRYHALDIDQILYRSTVYGIVAAVLAVLYAVVTAAIVSLLPVQSALSILAASGVATVCGVLLFDAVRRRVQSLVDRAFFRVRYDAASALSGIRARMPDAVDERDVAEHVVAELERILEAERVALLSCARDSAGLVILAERGVPAPELRIDPSRLPTEAAVSRSAVEAGETVAEADSTVLQALGAVALFPFFAEDGSMLGLIVAGRKRTRARLSLEDLRLLRGVAQEVGRAVERLRLREELREGRAEARRAEELARARSDFVSNVTHELRTPLTSIRMFAELLRTGDVPGDRAHDYLAIVEGEADRLGRLIQNVLDFGRVERSVKEYRFERFPADEAVCAALETMRYPLELGGFRLALSFGAPGLFVRADRDSFRQAIVNLVENAMKYSADAREIAVETREVGDELTVSVSDHGIGIAAEDQARIFEPFVRGSDQAVRQAPGAGLGLSIVKHIMESHGGRVAVQSAPGRGSTFTLVFPREASDAHPGD